MKRTVIITLALTLTSLVTARAQSADSRPPRPLPLLMAALDGDTNHVISAEEIANAPNALKTLDTNGDGQLSSEEIMPQRPDGAPGGQPPGGRKQFVPLIDAALDADGDGTISATEIANSAAALATLDKNSDGQLTEDEIMPRPPGGRGHGGPGGRGGPGGPGGAGGPPPAR